MLDIYDGSTLSEDLRQLCNATAAFLTDRYQDGSYVATPDDIAELQEVTAAFLADLADNEVFCVDNTGPGLLIPGEQFLLPIPIAVDRVRSTDKAATQIFNLIDECLNTQPIYEGMWHTPRLNAAIITDPEATRVQDTAPRVANPGELPQIVDLDKQQVLPQEHLHTELEDWLHLPGETNQVLDVYEHADRDGFVGAMDTASDDTGPAFDASSMLCRFQASDAASFFDLVADTVVSYTSFDQVLEMDDGYMQLAQSQHESKTDTSAYADQTEDKIDEKVGVMARIGANDICVDLDNIGAICDQLSPPPTPHFTRQGEPKIIRYLPTTWGKEIEPRSAASNYSKDSTNRRGFLASIELRREGVFDDEKNISFGKAGAEDLDGYFANDVWTVTLDLDLALTASQSLFTELVDGV